MAKITLMAMYGSKNIGVLERFQVNEPESDKHFKSVLDSLQNSPEYKGEYTIKKSVFDPKTGRWNIIPVQQSFTLDSSPFEYIFVALARGGGHETQPLDKYEAALLENDWVKSIEGAPNLGHAGLTNITLFHWKNPHYKPKQAKKS